MRGLLGFGMLRFRVFTELRSGFGRETDAQGSERYSALLSPMLAAKPICGVARRPKRSHRRFAQRLNCGAEVAMRGPRKCWGRQGPASE